MKIIKFISVAGLLLLAFGGCKKETRYTALLYVKLKDMPATYEEVNVEVIEVQIHSDADGWLSLDVNDSIYDLLQLQNNANAVLGSLNIPSGNVSQVRLILGTQNSVKVNNVVHPLSLSSQDESGLKLNVHQTLQGNQTYTLVLDFDAAQSVIDNGNNTYKLKPVISASFF